MCGVALKFEKVNRKTKDLLHSIHVRLRSVPSGAPLSATVAGAGVPGGGSAVKATQMDSGKK